MCELNEHLKKKEKNGNVVYECVREANSEIADISQHAENNVEHASQ